MEEALDSDESLRVSNMNDWILALVLTVRLSEHTPILQDICLARAVVLFHSWTSDAKIIDPPARQPLIWGCSQIKVLPTASMNNSLIFALFRLTLTRKRSCTLSIYLLYN